MASASVNGSSKAVNAASEFPANQHQDFWKEYSTRPLAAFLKHTGVYTPEQQESHLKFLHDVVVPRIGVSPDVKSLWTYHGSPFEFSVNLTDAEDPFVRFVFDPVGGDIGDGVTEPLPQDALLTVIPGLAEATRADMRWFYQIKEWLFLKKEEVMAVRKEWSAHPRVPQIFFAVDLHGEGRSLKAYMFPASKSTATGRSSVDIVMENVRRLEPYGDSLVPALDALEAYFPTSLEPLEVDCMAIDCVEPSQARVKIYAQAKLNTIKSVEHVVTYGGAYKNDITDKTMAAVRKIWPLILNDPHVADSDEHQAAPVDPESRYKTLSYSWEVRPGQAMPDLKIYIHLWLHARDNKTMLGKWEEIFRVNGWQWGGKGAYKNMIADAFGDEYLTADTEVIHTCASFQYTEKKGVYMTSYMSKPVPKVDA
ncbi:hypothetical protein LQW54_004523 [Pestalotiopsis sp. IQ-011]